MKNEALALSRRLRALPVFAAELPEFHTSVAPESPCQLFIEWLEHAVEKGEPEPHAMTLSTIDEDGAPDSRVLILKAVHDGRWWFASSAASRKGRQLSRSPHAALCFYWKAVGRQVRLRGTVVTAGRNECAEDFASRSPAARAVALAGRQSSPLASHRECADAVDRARAHLAKQPAEVPEDWRLYGLEPDEVEFWQADRGRRHVRLAYVQTESSWEQRLLWP